MKIHDGGRERHFLNITRTAGLRSYLKSLHEKGNHMIALDIEGDSNLHAYGEKLCLIQIYDGVEEVIIDPFKMDGAVLKRLFESTHVLKVMYDAGSDLALLQNAYDIRAKSILDLRPAVELLAYEKKDLHSVIACELNIVLEGKRRYQRYNWIRRPLSDDAITYALNDVIFLLSLKDILLAKLYSRKIVEPFFLKNLQIQNRDYVRSLEDRYRKVSGYTRLNEKHRTVFRRIFNTRDKYAKLYDIPPHHVLHKADMLHLASDARYLEKIRVSKKIDAHSQKEMLEDLRKAIVS